MIRYSREFDEKFRYDRRDLGVSCTEEGTVFKVWCPLADKVELHLYPADSGEECASFRMNRQKRGVFSWETDRCLHGTYYDYTVYREGKAVRTADPYAASCGCNGARSMAVDLRRTDPEGFSHDRAPALQAENIIYELHVKDFSYDGECGVPEEFRGKFKAFCAEWKDLGYPTGIRYLKELGVTHVHLLPIYDYGWLDEKGSAEQFNWGYDPVNYNVPEGSFSTNPHDGAVRIRECKEMIQSLHANGLRVVMDVVYNHTYEPDSWLERMVPGYYNRRWPDGSLADGSACGNDMACGRAMVDNYIADSVMYWAKEYHVDGFRFDLMGLLTVELMNRIRAELDEAFGRGEKLLYGEPWRAADSPMEENTVAALKQNIGCLDEGIAVFCDDTRDAIKGDVFRGELPGFVNGGRGLERKVLSAVSGWRDGSFDGFCPKSCAQVINYVSAHDNFTLWDKLALSMHGDGVKKGEIGKTGAEKEAGVGKTDAEDWRGEFFRTKYADVLRANRLAALICFTCQGHLFLQAGEEFGRTKLGNGNSYRSSPDLNMLRWKQTEEFSDLTAYYRGLIRLRKRLPGLCDKSAAAAQRIGGQKIWAERVVSFLVDNRLGEGGDRDGETLGECWKELFVVFNGGETEARVALPEGEGRWMVLADAKEADCLREVLCGTDGGLTVPAVSGMILGRRNP